MNCKSHRWESPGACAFCLQDRLLDLEAAQTDHASPSNPPGPVTGSVSPRRRSEDCTTKRRRHRHRFFSTPQVGPDTGGCTSKGSGGFSLLSFLFGRRESGNEGSGLGSRIQSVIGGGRKRRKGNAPEGVAVADEVRGRVSAPCRGMSPAEEVRGRASPPCRGMSPAEEDSGDETDSGYTTESSGLGRMRTPSPKRQGGAVAAPRHKNRIGRVSVFGVCLSPLVRATPSRRRNQTPEVGYSGDLRAGMKPQQTLVPNRSRKLADLAIFIVKSGEEKDMNEEEKASCGPDSNGHQVVAAFIEVHPPEKAGNSMASED